MDRYLLLFCNGSKNDYEPEEDILNLSTSYLSLLNDEHHFHNPSQFIKYFAISTIKVAFITLNQDGNKVQWKNIDVQDTNSLKTFILESKKIETDKLRNLSIIPDLDPVKTAVENLHKLADSLPYSGSYLLDFLWFYSDDKTCAIDKNYELYGALKRLVNWHNGQITIITSQKNTLHADIAEWMKFLNGFISPITMAPKSIFPSNLIWRGKLHVTDSQTGTEVSLPGFQLQYVMKKCFHSLSNDDDFNIQLDQASFSVKMEIVESISSDSIPLYFITSEKYHLSIINAKGSIKQSHKWFANVIRNPEISCILRLAYVNEGLAPYSDNVFNPTTKNWTQSIANGSFKLSVPSISSDSKQILFLLPGSKLNTTSCATLFRLRNPDELNGSISHQIFMHMPFCKSDNEDSDTQDLIAKHVEALPYLSQRNFSGFLELICDIQNKIIENWLDHLESKGMNRELSQEELSLALRIIQKELVKRINPYAETAKENESLGTKEEIDEIIPEYLVDPNDWTERRAVLNQEIYAEKFKRFKSSDTLAGMFPPSLDSAQVWNCSQILKCFHTSGLPRRNRMKNAVLIGGSNEGYQCPFHAVVSEQEMLSLSWPDIKHCHFHDIYYNRDESSEQSEERFCKIKERFVRHEISSTQLMADSEKKMLMCKNSLKDGQTLNNLTSKSSNVCPVMKGNEHSSKSAKKPLSPRRSPRKKLKSLEALQVLRRSPRKHHNSKLDKSTVGIRTSPRFKQKIHAKKRENHPQQHNPKNNCSKKFGSSSTAELSELHTKKLRAAVVDALSSEGIDMDHKLFKVCGKKLFAVCKTFIHDVLGKGRTSELMRNIAQAHVKQVIDFEKLLDKKS